ncbi:hypothetical protein, partial [Paraburkholderia terricola]|uniref:hypothetical protein n=1 Tax=Paraburkholderia terricola TaxID=169427 RepID=UPI00286D59CC
IRRQAVCHRHGAKLRFFRNSPLGCPGLLDHYTAIRHIQGVGRGLLIDIDIRYLNKDALWDLIALLWRYEIPLTPLQELATRKRFAWLRDERFYWHKSMFDPSRAD